MLNYPVFDGNEKYEYEQMITQIELIAEPHELPPQQQWAMMQNSPATSNVQLTDLIELQWKMIELANKYNYPAPLRNAEQLEFDWEMGRLLHENLKITPSVAGTKEMWLFFSLKVAPEIIFWRWGASEEHFLGDRRNYYGTQWWRYYLFYVAPVEVFKDSKIQLLTQSLLYNKADENQIAALYERTNSRGLPEHVFYILKWFHDKSPDRYTGKKKELFEAVVKRYNRELGFRNYFALSEDDKKELFLKSFEDCLALV